MHHSRYGNSRPQECLHFAAVIKNAKREGSVLDVYGGEYDEENKMVIWPITTARNQRLYFSHLKDKRFTIHPEINKKLMMYVRLDCKNTFSRKNILAGSSIYIKKQSKEPGMPKTEAEEHEQWNFEYLENGYIVISNVHDPDYVIDGSGPELTMQLRDEQKKSQFWSEIGRMNKG